MFFEEAVIQWRKYNTLTKIFFSGIAFVWGDFFPIKMQYVYVNQYIHPIKSLLS